MNLFPLIVAVAMGQQALRVAVVDVSQPDAIYEDVSRGLADDVVAALTLPAFLAFRVDERDLPGDCRVGPCLAEVAREQRAQVIVTVDAVELEKAKNGVAVAALWAKDGRPLAVRRYLVPAETSTPRKALQAFAAEVARQVRELQRAPGALSDGGSSSR